MDVPVGLLAFSFSLVLVVSVVELGVALYNRGEGPWSWLARQFAEAWPHSLKVPILLVTWGLFLGTALYTLDGYLSNDERPMEVQMAELRMRAENRAILHRLEPGDILMVAGVPHLVVEGQTLTETYSGLVLSRPGASRSRSVSFVVDYFSCLENIAFSCAPLGHIKKDTNDQRWQQVFREWLLWGREKSRR